MFLCFYGYSCISIALHWFITCAISRQTNLRYQINGFTKTRMQLWVRACIYQLWCLRMLATFLAPRFGFLLPQMGFYCILLRPARATQRKPSDSQTVIKGIDLGTRVVKYQVNAKRSSRESTWAPESSSGRPKDARGIQNRAKEYQKRAKRVTKVDQKI